SLHIQVDPKRFASAGILLTAIGYFFDYLISALPPEAKGSNWTGLVTIYLFCANQVFTGFAICLYCALVYRNRLYWALAAAGAAMPVTAVIFYGRREPAALLVLTTSLVIFFSKRQAPPRWAVASVLALATVAIPVTEEYRQALTQGQQFEMLREINV